MRGATAILLAALAPALAAATQEDGLALKRAGDFPAALAVFAGLVAANPRDVDALEQLATLRGWTGDHAGALQAWDQALALAPQYHGLRIGRARVLYWMGRHDEALAEVERAIAALPADADARELAGDIHRARHEPRRAKERYLEAAALAPGSGAADKAAKVRIPARWRLDAGGMLDDYRPANGQVVQRDEEQSAYLQLGRRLGETLGIGGGADYAHQFGLVDWRFDLEGWWTATPDLTLSARAAVTPEADFLPEREGALGGEWRASAWLVPLATVRLSDYAAERVVLLIPGLRLAPTGLPFTVEARWFHAMSDVARDTDAALLRVDATLGDGVRAWALGSYGRENQPPVGVAVTSSVAGGLAVDLDAAWTANFTLLWERREDVHRRMSVGYGITTRF
jgi:YaiO family outer membrane protein